MIHLRSIVLANFKGISELSCDFDDFTVLAGLNNSGKTTLLQGVYLLISALRPIAEHQHITHENPEVRKVSLRAALSPLGLRDTTWLHSHYWPEVTGTVTGVFSNDLTVELGVIRKSPSELLFTLSSPEQDVTAAITEWQTLSAGIFTPPGDVPTHETMVNGDQYQQQLCEGKGAHQRRGLRPRAATRATLGDVGGNVCDGGQHPSDRRLRTGTNSSVEVDPVFVEDSHQL